MPPHRIDQSAALELLRGVWSDHPSVLRRIDDLSRSLQVSERYLALPPEAYPGLTSFARRNEVWHRVALELGEEVLRRGLLQAGVLPGEVDHLYFVSTTGIATPSLDATLVGRLGLRPDVRRTPLFGLGCGGGAAALIHAHDHLLAYPEAVCVVVAVELCSLAFQPLDLSVANLIATLLFGDGAACVVLEGGTRAGRGAARIIAGASYLHPGTEQLAGWDVTDTGLRLVLSSEIPALLQQHLRQDVDTFLAAHGLRREQIDHWAVHTGSPKILRVFEETLSLPHAAIERSWRILAHAGNVSSVSVLYALDDMLQHSGARPGEHGLALALGPGLSVEALALQW
jgi:alkylresorcinol/alkylpyrone synthase